MNHTSNNENYQTHLYEGDQSKLYSGVLAHHEGSVQGNQSKSQIKRILVILGWLSVITLVELVFGMFGYGWGISKGFINTLFLLLTLLKAGLIVRVFMHLGDEKKNFVTLVLIPLFLFVWFIIAFLSDGHFWLMINSHNPVR